MEGNSGKITVCDCERFWTRWSLPCHRTSLNIQLKSYGEMVWIKVCNVKDQRSTSDRKSVTKHES